jgi:hypothetical protein
MQVSGDQAFAEAFCLSVLVCSCRVGIGLDMLLVADSPDQTAAGSEFNAAEQKKIRVNKWWCTP